jgi:DNA-binding NtrC family response regulator
MMADILIVDDERAMREIMTTALLLSGHHVEQAVDGNDAMHRMKRKTFDLVVTDLKMPMMDGRTMLRSMRKQGNTTPAVIVTGHQALMGRQISDQDSYEVVTKPFGIDQLALIANTALQRFRNRRSNCMA